MVDRPALSQALCLLTARGYGSYDMGLSVKAYILLGWGKE